jgi:pimeloyl-ACP methyl ester carboxylesterase
MIKKHFFTSKLIFFFTIFLFCSYSAQAKSIVLSTSDNYKIQATLEVPAGKPIAGVVLLHMYKHSKESWLPLTKILNKNNIITLAIDLRGHGMSKMGIGGIDNSDKINNRDKAFFNQMYLDAEAGLDFLLKNFKLKASQTGLIGASVGCSVAIHNAITSKHDTGALVLMTPGKNYLGIPTFRHINKWQNKPMLILSSHEEKFKGAEIIFQRLKKQNAELKLFDQENIHGTYMFNEVEEIESLITIWIIKKITTP